MHARLHASGASVQLIVAGYTIAYAVLLVTGARLGAILGYTRMFLSGTVVFTLASLGCGLAGCAAAFSPLMTRALMRVPVEHAAGASGLIATTIQLAIVTGVATFGTLYLNLAGRLPAHPLADSLRLVSAHAVSVTCVVLAAAIACGTAWAAVAGPGICEPAG
jgi:MFS family permease